MAPEERAKQLTDHPIWLTGIGTATNNYSGSWAELSEMRALKKACAKAYAMAGISSPREEIDFMEIFNIFSPFELMAYEALGLCGEGEGPRLLRDGLTDSEGDLPVNPSGGALVTNPLNSGGIYRIVQSILRMNNGAPKKTGRCLVHDSDMSIGAVGGDAHAVLVRERGE